MSAGGEAVGYVDGSRLHELREGRINIALWAERLGPAQTPVYIAPPATIPVEAVKALVAGWRIDGPASDKYADELTQLIKERSNG